MNSKHITKQTELSKSELLESVFNTSMLAIAVLNVVLDENENVIDFKIALVNEELERQTGRSDLVGKIYTETYPGVIESGVFSTMVEAYHTGNPAQKVFYYNYDGFDNWYNSLYVKTELGIVATNIDITKVKQAEIALKKERALQKRQVMEATFLAQEQERKRIAENLHNSIGQLLYGLKLSLNNFKVGATPVDYAELVKSKLHFEDQLSKIMKETRRISHQLSTMILEDFGLKAALEDICEQFGKNIECKLTFKGPEPDLGKAASIAVYRIAQELMLNIMKHAKATTADILVSVENNIISLQVTDNGVGFETNALQKGIGLKGIIGNVKLLNGKVKLTSNPEAGTKIVITIPYSL